MIVRLMLLSVSVLLVSGSTVADLTGQETFRDPFVLKLRLDDDKYHHQQFGKVPYVYQNKVFLFAGEEFGVKINKTINKKHKIKLAKNIKNADIVFRFDQKQIQKPTWGMVLIVRNKTKKTIKYKVMMTMPGKRGIYRTTTVPIQPGLVSYEHWPHPILQLVLTDIKMN